MFKTAPDPVDVLDFQFKLRCRLKAFDNKDSAPFSKQCNLVAAASRFGLIFIGSTSSNFQVVQLKQLERFGRNDGDVSDYPCREVPLPSPPKYLSTNCEHTILAVVVDRDDCPCVLFYDVKSFWRQAVVLVEEARLSATPGVGVLDVGWNPALGSVFTACKSDGTLGVYELKYPGIDINELPPAAGATCFCWSPKGKQIAVGSRDGKITQYKPDLKAVKMINAPPLNGPQALLSLQWISNYQFMGVYRPPSPDGQACLIVVDAPKTGDPAYTNYDDICYSNGATRPAQFYMLLQQQWNVLMMASANSMEVGVLGVAGESWTQWIMGDAARAELPLSSDHQDTLPVGFAVDIGSTQPIPWGESTLPPAPLLLLLSHYGTLCCFNIINLKEGVPGICTPPDPIDDTSGASLFVARKNEGANTAPVAVSAPGDQQQTPQLPKAVQPQPTKTLSFGTTPPTQPTKTVTFATTPPTSAQSTNLFGTKPGESVFPNQSQSVPLFGGQVTLTPVHQQQQKPASAIPQSILSALGGHKVASTPAAPPYGTLPAAPPYGTPPAAPSYGTPPAAPSYGTPPAAPSYGTPPAAPPYGTPPAATSTSPPFGTPTAATTAPPAFGTPKPIAPPNSVSQFKPNETRELVKQSEVTDSKDDTESEALYSQMVRDECVFLETELRVLLHQGRTLRCNLGTDSDKTNMVTTTESLEEFLKEVVDISKGQSAEVHCLKQNLLQSFAWFEEAKSRHVASKDEAMAVVLRAQPLDPASEKQLQDIRHLSYYLETQLAQANRCLDDQWDSFQDYCRKTVKLQIPTMEAIFQAMVKQNAIVQKQSYILKDVANRIRNKSKSAIGPPLLISMDDPAELEEELKRLRLGPEDISQIQYRHVANRNKSLSKNKVGSLRSFLGNRDFPHVSVVKPQLSNSTFQASPSVRLKQLSLLGAKMSPVLKEKDVAKRLDFVQSTPKPVSAKQSETPPNTPINLLHNFTFKFESSHFKDPPEKAFAPVSKTGSIFGAKSAISSGPNSAFVSTSFGATTSTSVTSLAAPKPVIFGTTAPKTAPSFVVSTTQTTASPNQPVITISTKPFSFNQAGPQVSEVITASVAKTTAPLFGGGTTPTAAKPSLNFFGPSLTITSSNAPASTAVKPASTSTVVPGFNVSIVNKPSTISATPVFGASSISPSTKPLALTTTSAPTLVGLLSSKASDGTASSLKTFTFSPAAQTTATTSTTTVPATKPPVILSIPTAPTSKVTQNDDVKAVGTTGSSAQVTSASTASVFASKPSIFGAFTATNGSQSPSVGSTAPGTTLHPSLFGSTVSSPTTTQSSIFAAALTSQGSIFGGGASNTSIVQGSLFRTTTTPSAVQGSIFGNAAKSTGSSIFGTAGNSGTTQSSVLGVTGNGTTTQSSVSGTTPSPSIFASVSKAPQTSVATNGTTAPAVTAATTIVFGGATVTSSQPTTTATSAALPQSSSFVPVSTAVPQSSIFGTVSSTMPSGDASTTKPPFATTTSTSSIFGSTSDAASSSTATKPSAFDSAPSSLFGAAPTTTTSLFGAAPTATTTSIFGATPTTTTGSVFGGFVPASKSSIFGSATSTASAVFGTGSQSSVFGSNTATTQFGSTATTQFGGAPAFGTVTTSAPFGQSVFEPPKSTAASIFGQGSVFGGGTPTNTFGGTGGFGAPTTTSSAFSFGQSSGSVFGNAAATTTTGSIFGGTPTTSSAFGTGGSIFGTPASTSSSPFGMSAPATASVFATTASQPSSFSFASAAAGTTAGSFGFGGLNVSSTSTTSSGTGFGFGAQGATSNPFGLASQQDQKSVFGGESKSLFGAPPSTSSSTSIFGSAPAFGSGGSQSFGSSTFGGQPSTFGQSTFGSGTFSSQSSAGPFSGGAGSVSQAGFGGSPGFQKSAGGFAPVFGSASPAFGGAASFGGAPAFGSSPSFGSPSKVFGGAPTTGFGSPAAAQNTSFGNLANQPTVGFGNLANQQTVGFGNLAQQTGAAPSTPFSGNSSFSSWR